MTGGILALSACASGDGETDKLRPADKPVEEMYSEAAAQLDQDEYKKAQQTFEDVERLYPYSQWATQAQLMGAYAAYQDLRYDEAVLALDRFAELHPSSERIDYALYLRALCYYEQITDVKRDQEMTQKALESLGALIQRYPDSSYTKDAKLKRDLTLDHLAGKEMEIGRYYLKRGDVNAAIGRFTIVIRNYQTTTHVPEALHRLVEAYTQIGLISQATKVAAVLGHNFPGSKWYQDSYALLTPEARAQLDDDRSFVDRTVESLLKP